MNRSSVPYPVGFIDRADGRRALLAAPRAVGMVAVAWSPAHHRTRPVLEALAARQGVWLPGWPVTFFELWPEEDAALNPWYEAFCREIHPRFRLHGDGWAPLWWLVEGEVVDCLPKPWEAELVALEERSAAAFRAGVRGQAGKQVLLRGGRTARRHPRRGR